MSKAMMDSLISALQTGASIQSNISGTVGEFVRTASEKARHEFFISKYELRKELADMIYRAYKYDYTGGKYKYVGTKEFNELSDIEKEQQDTIAEFNDVFSEPDLVFLADKVYDNISSAVDALVAKNVPGLIVEKHIESDRLVVSLSSTEKNANVFRRISEDILVYAFGTGEIRQTIGDFLQKHVSSLSGISGTIISSTKVSSKTGVMVAGHGESSSNDIGNIQNALQILLINKIRNNQAAGKVTPATKKELEEFDRQLSEILDDDVAVEQLFDILLRKGVIKYNKTVIPRGVRKGQMRNERPFSNSELRNYLKSLMSFQIDFVRTFDGNGDLHLSLAVEAPILDKNQLSAEAKEIIVSIRPQGYMNNSIMGGLATHLGNLFREEYTGVLNELRGWFSGDPKFEYLLPGIDPTKFKGSPSAVDMVESIMLETFLTGKAKPQKVSSSAKSSSGGSRIKATPIKQKINTSQGMLGPKKAVPTITPRARNSKGQFQSLVNVVNIINMQLADKIRQNMGTPRLNYRTGRFANSAKVVGATMGQGGTVNIPYTYMKLPYQTFEPGFRQGSPARDPRTLISKSIREIATGLVTSRLRIVRV